MAEAKKPSTKTNSKTAKSSEASAKTEDLKVIKKAEEKAVIKVTEKIEELAETEAIAEKIVEQEKELDKTSPKEAKSNNMSSKSKATEETPAKAEGKVAKASDSPSKPLAKSGKRSSKSIKKAEEKAAKEERKAHASEPPKTEVKPAIVKVRSRLERQGKKFREAVKLIDKSKEYSLKEALDLAAKTSPVKFDATIELHIRLNVDPKHADQNIRSSLVLPAGTGKNVKVAVFADVADVAKAKQAGADIAAGDEFLQALDKEKIDFDVLIATPAMMPKLGKYARLLGPKGLMPSPKSGTVTPDVAKAVKEAKAGKIEYRVDSTGIVHATVGKVSFSLDDLVKNASAIFANIKAVKPASTKGTYILSVFATTSMGPSVKINPSEV